MRVISNPSDIDALLPPKWADSFSARKKAIEIYLKSGGIIKVGEVKGSWPRLVYPTVEKLESDINTIEKEIERINRQIEETKKRKRDLQDTPDKMLKVLLDPLYWKHRMKLLRDPEYREVYELVRPPIHLLHRPDWRRKIEIFVKSEEYRNKLKEARLSEIGKRRDFLDVEVEKRMEFSRSVVSSLSEKLEAKKNELEQRLNALKTLLSWAKSSQS